MRSSRAYRYSLFLLLTIGGSALAGTTDEQDLSAMLHSFLAGASDGSIEAHERFWAEDLVYTSSNGTRTDKAGILATMTEPSADAGDGTVYTAEDIDIRVYGDTAIVAFRLVGTSPDAAVTQYFNTGTFLRRGGTWRAVAWQATRIAPGRDRR